EVDHPDRTVGGTAVAWRGAWTGAGNGCADGRPRIRSCRRYGLYLQHFAVPARWLSGDVDGCRFRDARSRTRPLQERLHAMPEEHLDLLDRLVAVLAVRLQPDVRRGRRWLHRFLPAEGNSAD